MASRKEYYVNRDASKVYLFDCFARWRSFKEERNLRTDRDVANILLNEYMARNVVRNWGKFRTCYHAVKDWNWLAMDITNSANISIFKRKLYGHLID